MVAVPVIPGADMALVTRQVLVGGPALAQKTIVGNLTGLLIHGAALAAGLSALLVASATAYTVGIRSGRPGSRIAMQSDRSRRPWGLPRPQMLLRARVCNFPSPPGC